MQRPPPPSTCAQHAAAAYEQSTSCLREGACRSCICWLQLMEPNAGIVGAFTSRVLLQEAALEGEDSGAGAASSAQPDGQQVASLAADAEVLSITAMQQSSAVIPAASPGALPASHAAVEAMPSAPPRPVTIPADVLAQFGTMHLGNHPVHEASAAASITAGFGQTNLHGGPCVTVSTVLPSSGMQRQGPSKVRVTAPAADGDLDSQEQEEEDCTVCWSAAPCVVFQPCGHLCCCAACAKPFVAAKALCPMCRGTVTAAITL